jgi:hypothetical protein
MFRCYFIENGRISWGDDLSAPTLAEAIELGRDLRRAFFEGDHVPGMEIWQQGSLLYQDAREFARIQMSSALRSPFDTAPSTMYPTWRPTRARPLMAQASH